jgi:hypothetical protein
MDKELHTCMFAWHEKIAKLLFLLKSCRCIHVCDVGVREARRGELAIIPFLPPSLL